MAYIAPMILAKYLDSRGIKRAFFAKRVKLSQSHLSMIAAGRRKASPAVAKRIAAATDGAVPAAALMSRQNAALAAMEGK